MTLDESIFRTLNDLALQTSFSDKVYIFSAEYLPFIVGALAIILFFVWRKSWTHKLQLLFISALTVAVSYAIVYYIFHEWWPRLRPFDGLLNVHQLIGEYGLSFPSQHAMLFFLLATIIYWIRPRVSFWFFFVAIIISLSRVIVGVHYPSDILVGAVFGVVMGFVTMYVARFFRLGKILK